MKRCRFSSMAFPSACIWLMVVGSTIGQDRVITTPDGQAVVVQGSSELDKPGVPPNSSPGINPNPGEQGKNDGKGGEAGKGPAGPAPTKRPTEPPSKPDPKELEVRPDQSGRVEFSFRNQPWPALIEWLAEISGEPLDWQELPGDFVNIASPRAFSVLETQDLFNRHLLSRGYTMLRLDGGLAVVKATELNPALVPAVTPEDLAKLPQYQFVRTTFSLDWLQAEKLAKELAPLISAAGKLVPLAETNRIEAMDAVANLRRISELLRDEQSSEARGRLAREFQLRVIPAAQAKTMLAEFLGVSQDNKSPMDPRQLQQMMQMLQQGGGGGGEGRGKAGPPQKEPEVHIVANERNNSLIVHAPADRMAIAAEFVKRIDVPAHDLSSLADMQARVQTFRLTSITPERLQEMLLKMNVLEPTTRLTSDSENRALIVFGSVADRFVVEQLVKRLDGSARKFSVIQLRRLDPRDVAESIHFLMGINPEKKEDNNRSRYSYFYWDDRRDTKKKKEDEFRVAANVQNRQVMLWATDVELKEVNSLLVKLGEIPPEQGLGSRIRVIDATNSQQTYEYLERLQKQLQLTTPHRLTLPPREQFNKGIEVLPKEDSGKDAKEEPVIQPPKIKKGVENSSPTVTSASVHPAAKSVVGNSFVSAIDSQEGEEDPPSVSPGSVETRVSEEPIRSSEDFDRVFGKGRPSGSDVETPAQPRSGLRRVGAEIRIELDADGNLVLMSDDPEALNQVETMMLQTPPPRRPYVVFHIKFGPASFIKANLEEYFSDFIEKKKPDRSSEDRFYRYLFDIPDDPEKQRLGLGEAPKLRFISDSVAGTIVVTGATEKQLQTIEELIRLWDVPEPSNIKNSRFTKLVEVKYSKASVIAETLKEAYRDLLSSNDKAFARKNENEESRSGGGSGMTDSKSGQNSGATSFSFKGDLSIGVDDVGNTLLISAKGQELLSLVIEMIHQLDAAAQPSNAIEVIPATSKGVENAIRAALGKGASSSGREFDSSSSSSNNRSSSRSK